MEQIWKSLWLGETNTYWQPPEIRLKVWKPQQRTLDLPLLVGLLTWQVGVLIPLRPDSHLHNPFVPTVNGQGGMRKPWPSTCSITTLAHNNDWGPPAWTRVCQKRMGLEPTHLIVIQDPQSSGTTEEPHIITQVLVGPNACALALR